MFEYRAPIFSVLFVFCLKCTNYFNFLLIIFNQTKVFALVTKSGSLIAYNRYIAGRALLKTTAHSGDATAVDWHPLRPNIIATGGSTDRCVKVWDLEIY